MRRIIEPILRLIGNLRQDRRNADQETELCVVVMTMRDAGPSTASQPRIQQNGADIGQEIGSNINCRRDDHRCFNQRNITILERIDQEPAETWIGEYLLDDDNAANEIAEIDRSYV